MNSNKILVNLIVPSLSKNYNVFIPVNKTITETILLLTQTINEITEGAFPLGNNYSLVNCETNEICNYDYSVSISNIPYGATLALI